MVSTDDAYSVKDYEHVMEGEKVPKYDYTSHEAHVSRQGFSIAVREFCKSGFLFLTEKVNRPFIRAHSQFIFAHKLAELFTINN